MELLFQCLFPDTIQSGMYVRPSKMGPVSPIHCDYVPLSEFESGDENFSLQRT